jgi:hypothetical protein
MIKNFLLSLQITLYIPSLAQVLHIVQRVNQAINSPTLFYENALASVRQNQPAMARELILVAELLVQMGYKATFSKSNEVQLEYAQYIIFIQFDNEQLHVKRTA